MPTSTDDKLAAMIGELAASFAEFKVEYATQRAEARSDLRELGTQIKSDLRELEARINGDIRELKAQIDGSIQNLDTKFGTGLHSLEKRVDRGFGFQMWLAGFLIPATIGLVSAAISLAFSAGHLDSSVKQLSARMDGLEKSSKAISPISRQLNSSPPISPPVANPPERIFELRPKERMIAQIDKVIAAGNDRQPDEDVPFFLGMEPGDRATGLDAGTKPEWLTSGMGGLVLLDSRITADNIVSQLSFIVFYIDKKFMEKGVYYQIKFQVKRSDLEKFKNKILSIDPAGNLPFSIYFVRP